MKITFSKVILMWMLFGQLLMLGVINNFFNQFGDSSYFYKLSALIPAIQKTTSSDIFNAKYASIYLCLLYTLLPALFLSLLSIKDQDLIISKLRDSRNNAFVLVIILLGLSIYIFHASWGEDLLFKFIGSFPLGFAIATSAILILPAYALRFLIAFYKLKDKRNLL